jgi:hypothetical protein
MTTRPPPRRQRAIEARDHALKLIRAHGEWRIVRPHRMLAFERGELFILHRTPFQRQPEPSESVKYLAELTGKAINRPYGLDIWARGKILNIKWDDNGAMDVVSFRAWRMGKPELRALAPFDDQGRGAPEPLAGGFALKTPPTPPPGFVLEQADAVGANPLALLNGPIGNLRRVNKALLGTEHSADK